MLALSAAVQLCPAGATLGIGRQRQWLVGDSRIAMPTLPVFSRHESHNLKAHQRVQLAVATRRKSLRDSMLNLDYKLDRLPIFLSI